MQPGSSHDAALSRRALLLSLRPDASALASAITPQVDRVDWDWVVACAKAHKVAALLAARLETSGLSALLGPDMRAQLNTIRDDAVARAAMAERTLELLAEHLGRAAVPFLVIKGSILAHHVYRQPNLRRFADVDVVVRQEHVARAEDVLRAIGYREGGAEEILAARPKGETERSAALALSRRFEARVVQAYTWYAPSDGRLLCIDLHWHVARGALQISSAQLWERAAPTTVAHTHLTTLDPSATLIHLAMHATTCLLGNFRLLHLCDVAWAATRFADQETAVWQLARAWRVEAPLTFAFQLVEQTLGIPVPVARPVITRSRRSVVVRDSFMLASPQLKNQAGPVRLWRELVWGWAMRCLRWNVWVMIGVSFARAQWQLFRWRNGMGGRTSV